MPWEMDYIDICNMEGCKLEGWLRKQEWRYKVRQLGPGDWPYKRGKKNSLSASLKTSGKAPSDFAVLC